MRANELWPSRNIILFEAYASNSYPELLYLHVKKCEKSFSTSMKEENVENPMQKCCCLISKASSV